MAACGGSSPTTSSASNYDGQWSGTTSQGTSITFTVSGQRVTNIAFNYDFRGCVGAKTISNPNVIIVQTSPSPLPGNPVGPGFIYSSNLGGIDASWVMVVGAFPSNITASGTADYANCTSTSTVIATDRLTWSAVKR
jgi:hypothetical protein